MGFILIVFIVDLTYVGVKPIRLEFKLVKSCIIVDFISYTLYGISVVFEGYLSNIFGFHANDGIYI